MTETQYRSSLFWFAVVVALCALGLIGMGGLVTSHGVGMAVPDWPTSYGYNMFALPLSMWLTGGVFHEHTHRLWASLLGVLVVALTRWLGGREARLPLLVIGLLEAGAGLLLPLLGPEWKGAGYFLSGIGGVVLLAALVWVRSAPAARPLPALKWLAFWLVQLQGLLGGLRVVLDAHVFAGTKLGVVFGVFHGCLAQVLLVLLVVIALLTSRWWVEARREGDSAGRAPAPRGALAGGLALAATALIFLQLLLGATMRHQHAGLAISDFPLAYGRLWPDLSPEAVQRYNAARVEVSAQDPITASQIVLQLAHRAMAVVILGAVAAVFWQMRRHHAPGHGLRRWTAGWLALVLAQAGLGAWTIWSNKAADVATLHVLGGASALVMGTLISIMDVHFNIRCCGVGQFLASHVPRVAPSRVVDGDHTHSAA
jgi:cytochrome c oxidase assembly protein subunit 15